MPARQLVLVHVDGGALAGRADGRGRLASDQLLGRARSHRFCKDYSPHKEHEAEVVVDPYDGPWPPAKTAELTWPYPDAELKTRAFWDGLDEAGRRGLAADEAAQIEAIAAVLVPRLRPGAVVVDVACSHGHCLARLQRQRPDLVLHGRDLAPTMVAATRALVASADVRVGDARALGELAVDAVVSRAFSQEVMSREDALAGVREAHRVLTPGGLLVLHSLLPPLVGRGDLEPLGRVVQTTWYAAGVLTPLYLVERGRGAA